MSSLSVSGLIALSSSASPRHLPRIDIRSPGWLALGSSLPLSEPPHRVQEPPDQERKDEPGRRNGRMMRLWCMCKPLVNRQPVPPRPAWQRTVGGHHWGADRKVSYWPCTFPRSPGKTPNMSISPRCTRLFERRPRESLNVGLNVRHSLAKPRN